MGLVKIFIVSTLMSLLAYKFYRTVIFLKPGKTVFQHAPGPCQVISDAKEGSEDFALLPDGQVLITTGLRFKSNKFPNRRGKIILYDFDKQESVIELKLQFNDASFFKDIDPHGIDVFEDSHGNFIVFVVNHIPHEAVELFSLDLNNKILVHLESITSSSFHLLNSVIAYGERQFYFTNFQYFNKGIMLKWERDFLNIGSVGYFDGQTARILVSGYNAPNGLALSRDKNKLYLANVGDLSLDTFSINEDGTLSLAHALPIDTSVDNIQIDPVDGSLWLGCHPSRWLLRQFFSDPHHNLAPSQVLQVRVDKQDLPSGDVTEWYVNNGTEISASAVAVRYGQHLLIGSVNHNLVHCEIKSFTMSGS